MDFLEKTFEKYWKSPREKIRLKSTTVCVKKITPYLLTVAGHCLPQAKQIQISPSLWSCGLYNQEILLPDFIGIFDDYQLNKKLYLLLTIRVCALASLKIEQKIDTSSRIARRLETLLYFQDIMEWEKRHFPYIEGLQQEIYTQLKHLSPEKGELLNIWEEVTFHGKKIDLHALIKKQKRNDSVPTFLHYTIPTLCVRGGELTTKTNQDLSSSLNQKPSTEKTRDRSENKKEIKFEEKENTLNPVHHSFEKMETADDYEGGRKLDSGDDELESHANALDEVELSQVTKDGETSKSSYRQEGSGMDQSLSSTPRITTTSGHLYQEWNYKKNNYLQDYCEIFEHTLTVNKPSSQFKEEIWKKYKNVILEGQRKIHSIYNTPLWEKRLFEGSEVDIDSAIVYYSDLQNRTTPSLKIYEQKNKKRTSLSVTILFDQSLSTDSWVDNQRILDVILDSIGICGHIFEDVIPKVMIAGMNSATHRHIDFNIYKKYDDPWSNFYSLKESITPSSYTRMGPAIRHACELVKKNKQKTNILLILTDGRPTDLDKYEGSHGLADIRQAIREATQAGIFTHGLTIEKENKIQFTKMFEHYSVLPSASRLPQELIQVLLKSLL